MELKERIGKIAYNFETVNELVEIISQLIENGYIREYPNAQKPEEDYSAGNSSFRN